MDFGKLNQALNVASSPYSGHRVGSLGAAHTVEYYVDFTCPFSRRIFNTLTKEIIPYVQKEFGGSVQFILRHQVQPWHPQSTLLHEASLAAEKVEPKKFMAYAEKLFDVQRDYFDEACHNLSRTQIYHSLAEHAAFLGIDREEFLSYLLIPDTEPRNKGNKIHGDLKYHIKLARQNGIHVSPTVLIDGIIDSTVSSSWGLNEWRNWLQSKV
ncbi:hypothetical protein K493DRAFT_342040 [Basidiobolus meristosporus CBS 931.73]|uniref:Thioredoxin-like fold domain-containing protein n=1 Tax=Basidiobolus meristosporus CBS 931.73 TaxID=1314790 RepID=A0A1Y1XDF6_9FUNG|nr:hypothetical protein K493DRAFT_342040 [Basidiobolus meristosporus CBS 931.73]|eukprot:ORX83404.1 hypothetical protein K493DRAFT_342040 [Basidiobolus meristosporus CBS 931.73]